MVGGRPKSNRSAGDQAVHHRPPSPPLEAVDSDSHTLQRGSARRRGSWRGFGAQVPARLLVPPPEVAWVWGTGSNVAPRAAGGGGRLGHMFQRVNLFFRRT